MRRRIQQIAPQPDRDAPVAMRPQTLTELIIPGANTGTGVGVMGSMPNLQTRTAGEPRPQGPRLQPQTSPGTAWGGFNQVRNPQPPVQPAPQPIVQPQFERNSQAAQNGVQMVGQVNGWYVDANGNYYSPQGWALQDSYMMGQNGIVADPSHADWQGAIWQDGYTGQIHEGVVPGGTAPQPYAPPAAPMPGGGQQAQAQAHQQGVPIPAPQPQPGQQAQQQAQQQGVTQFGSPGPVGWQPQGQTFTPLNEGRPALRRRPLQAPDEPFGYTPQTTRPNQNEGRPNQPNPLTDVSGPVTGPQGQGQNQPSLPLSPEAEAIRRGLEDELAAELAAITTERGQIPAMVNLFSSRLQSDHAENLRQIDESLNSRGVFNSGIRSTDRARANRSADRSREDFARDIASRYSNLAGRESGALRNYNNKWAEALLELVRNMATDENYSASGTGSTANSTPLGSDEYKGTPPSVSKPKPNRGKKRKNKDKPRKRNS